MGPTNIALVKLLRADNALRQAQERYDTAAKTVKVQERRLADLHEKHKLAETNLRQQQTRAGTLDLDVKTRDARIEKLRAQQQSAKNNKEYQAFLTEINTEKIDKGKAEDEQLKVMEEVEKTTAEVKALQAQIDEAQKLHDATKQQLGGRLSELQHEIDKLRPGRDEAATAVPAKWRDLFERLAERYEGEAMAAISRPNKRREEYICTSCNMDLVVDIYNRLHTRDEPVFCPSCRRFLYIPDDLPPEMAVNKKKPQKEPKPAADEQEEEQQETAAD
jgi:predicted  nucleic acid-binding Zn-ribbon protein